MEYPGLRAAASCALHAVMLVTASWPAAGQGYPERAVRIIVPTAPGGSIDTTARVLAAKLGEGWGKPVVIDNRPGAGMIIGAEAAARAAPDGYTLLVAHDRTMAMNPVVYPNLPYQPQRDFEPLALLVAIPEVVLVHAALPVKSIPELIVHAKANPGSLNHATGGTATLLALELFKAMAGVDIRQHSVSRRRTRHDRDHGRRDADHFRRPCLGQRRDGVGEIARPRGDHAGPRRAAAGTTDHR
jgi:tripartite-type tricarboxylate transporter receptor subunit TctC